MRAILTIGAWTTVYALALASLDPWDLALGAVISAAVFVAFRRFLFVTPPLEWWVVARRLGHVPMLVAATAVNIVRGTVAVIRLSLGPIPPTTVGFVTIPAGERTATGVVVSGLLDTLSPGSVLIDDDPEARTWTIHSVDASDPKETRRELQHFYEQYQRPVWP